MWQRAVNADGAHGGITAVLSIRFSFANVATNTVLEFVGAVLPADSLMPYALMGKVDVRAPNAVANRAAAPRQTKRPKRQVRMRALQGKDERLQR